MLNIKTTIRSETKKTPATMTNINPWKEINRGNDLNRQPPDIKT